MIKFSYKFLILLIVIIISLGGLSANDLNESIEIVEYQDSVNDLTDSSIVETNIKANDIEMYFQNGTRYEVLLTDSQENPLNDAEIIFTIFGVNYTKNTNNEGIASLAINLNSGTYNISTLFKGNEFYAKSETHNNITVLSSILANDLVKMYRNDSHFYASFFDFNGNPLINYDVTFNINGVFYTRTTNHEGIAFLSINLNPGEYILTNINPVNNEMYSNKINVLSTLMNNSDVLKYYRNDTQYSISVLDSNGNLIANTSITFNIHGVFYTRITNENGIAILNINLDPGEYIITAIYEQLSLSNTIHVLARLYGQDLAFTYGDNDRLIATLLDSQGNFLSGETVTFNVNGELFTYITNDEGKAILDKNLNSGSYYISFFVDGDSNINLASNNLYIKNNIELNVFNWNSGGDLSRNSLIYNNVPDSDLLREIIEIAKSGTPMVTIKGGDGEAVFLTAGVHGNELSSQVAIMQLINYLESNPVKGTVYIIPFVAPSMTASNIRYFNNNINLNGVANQAGSITNNIINLALEFNVKALGDFHCTRPGGDPGQNVAMGTYSPTYESANIAKAIASLTGQSYIIYSKVGDEYEDAVEDVANLNGIPAVTCEVVTPHGTIATGSVEKSFSQMITFLQYTDLI